MAEAMQHSVHEGVPHAARTLIWEVFFRSRGRGIDLPAHSPWIDDSTGVTTILIGADQPGDEPKAAAGLVIKEAPMADGRKVGLVGLVCVDEAFRGKGLGHQLVAAATEVGRNQAFDTLVLWTNKPNVYAKHGFAVDSADRYGPVWTPAHEGMDRPFCHDLAGLKTEDISARGIPAFAKSVLVFSGDSAAITVLPTVQGYTLADWRGDWDGVFRLIEQVLPAAWSLNALADSAILAELHSRAYKSDLSPGSYRMVHELSGRDHSRLPYIPLLNRI
ncbi:hypothetical protein LMG19282_02250 [Cupriavidus campinensis]|uniref:GNAT family N-acetyltransferase n=1 Tax=Cupriavidus campinensis TaxID=151783 RepID=UPI001B29E793|nr:GNAT family N-acetyltransferase [Cupriavidus campinensis]CAG2142591.1 hypothetical protein LMG19282_02250 [Cupriavidus campinensis]